ncbi:MAG: nucleotidyltransferase family protein [Fuerstiella sp.]
MTRCKAVLLAAGLGTRLRPITDSVPKCLVPINGRPLLDYWFDALRAAEITDVLINTHHLRDQVVEFIEHKNQDGFAVQESWEPELLGSAGTIHANRNWCQNADDCLIVYADNLSNVNLLQFLEFHRSHHDPFSMLLFRTDVPKSCGIATLDSEQRITEFIEKPEQPSSNLANGGVYAVAADAWREIADRNAFDLGFDVLPTFVNRMKGWPFDGFHLDIGSHQNLERANREAGAAFAGQQQV